MSVNRLSLSLTVGWGVVVLGTLVSRMALVDTPMPAAAYAGWLFAIGAPAAVSIMLARGQAAPSITQVLYDAEHAGDDRKGSTSARG
jgi:hypothetical protein